MNETPKGWDLWRGTFLGLDRSRGRELVENQDSSRIISVGL
jgi:hypothetical protein